eukprot:PITA_02895
MEINKEKSCTFIFNSPDLIKAHLTRTLGFRTGELPTKYLGNQLSINPTRVSNLFQIIDKLKRRLENWSFRSLNIAGRLVLLKSILQAIPIYPLSVTATPKGACAKMKEIFGKFRWGGPKQEKKWALVSWKGISKQKEKGGLGLRDPGILNQVLRAKLWWEWMTGGKDIWKQIWNQKYSMPSTTEGILRVKPEEWDENIDEVQKEILTKELEARRIKNNTRPDILRWGKSTKGFFTVKEAYYLATRQEGEEEDIDWKQIWRNKWWPKVTIFAWLVGKRRILTWDKLQKRGFQGPPRCSLCKQENETQENLLNSCPYAQHQWEEVRNLFAKSNRDQNDIK